MIETDGGRRGSRNTVCSQGDARARARSSS
jgi:hypothetical protein